MCFRISIKRRSARAVFLLPTQTPRFLTPVSLALKEKRSRSPCSSSSAEAYSSFRRSRATVNGRRKTILSINQLFQCISGLVFQRLRRAPLSSWVQRGDVRRIATPVSSALRCPRRLFFSVATDWLPGSHCVRQDVASRPTSMGASFPG